MKKIGFLYVWEYGYYVIVDIKVFVDLYIIVEEGYCIGKYVKEIFMK